MELDASHGEGGGQVVRTALALAAVTGTDVTLRNVRAERDDPGLSHQHLACLEALAALCDADVEGTAVGAERVAFDPSTIAGGRYEVDIGTAGSTTLLAQAVLPAAVHADGRVRVEAHGGTDVRWSPTSDELRSVVLPLLARAGVDATAAVERRGYYPEGGGLLTLDVAPGDLRPLEIRERGPPTRIAGVSAVGNLERGIGERQRDAARERLRAAGIRVPIAIDVEVDDDARSTGTSIALWSEREDGSEGDAGGGDTDEDDADGAPAGTRLGGSALGEPGKPAEDVGREAADALLDALDGPGTVDRYVADQLVPYVALAGGRYVAPERTSHLETNAWVCRRFGYDIAVEAAGAGAAGAVLVAGDGGDAA